MDDDGETPLPNQNERMTSAEVVSFTEDVLVRFNVHLRLTAYHGHGFIGWEINLDSVWLPDDELTAFLAFVRGHGFSVGLCSEGLKIGRAMVADGKPKP